MIWGFFSLRSCGGGMGQLFIWGYVLGYNWTENSQNAMEKNHGFPRKKHLYMDLKSTGGYGFKQK